MIASRVALGRWRMAWNTLFGVRRGTRASRPRRPLLGGTLAIALAGMVCIGLAGLFGQLVSRGAGAAEAGGVLALVLTAALFGMLLFDLHEAVSTLVVDSDLELLRRAPVGPGSLFALKLADALPRTSLLMLVLAVPAVVAFHVFYPLPAWAWLLLPLQLLGLWAIPLGLGAALALEMLRHLPPRRAREALGFLSTVAIFVLWLANSFLVPRIAAPEGDPLEGLRALDGAAALHAFSPGHWIAGALVGAARGDVPGALRPTAILLIVAAVSLAIAAAVASRALEAIQAAIAGGGEGRRATRDPARALRRHDRPAGRRTFVGAVLARDRRLFVRDWAVLGDVLTTATLWTLLPLLGAPLYQASSHELARAMLLGLTVGLGYEVGARALPFERQGIAWARLGPVPAGRWIAAKLTGAAALSLPLMVLAAASMAFTMRLRPAELIETLCIAIPALGLSLAVGIWTGAAFGQPAWTNPRAMLTVSGRAAATLLLVLQAGAWLALSAVAEMRRETLPAGVVLWAPAVLAVVLSIAPLRAATARLATREWSA